MPDPVHESEISRPYLETDSISSSLFKSANRWYHVILSPFHSDDYCRMYWSKVFAKHLAFLYPLTRECYEAETQSSSKFVSKYERIHDTDNWPLILRQCRQKSSVLMLNHRRIKQWWKRRHGNCSNLHIFSYLIVRSWPKIKPSAMSLCQDFSMSSKFMFED